MSKNNKHHSSRSHGRNFLSIIFAFLLAVMLTVIGLALVAQVAVRRFSVRQAFNDEFVKSATGYIEDTISDYTMPTGIDLSVLDGLFTEDRIREDFMQAVAQTFEGTEYTPDVSTLNAELVSRVTDLFASSGVSGEDTQEIIETYADEITELYEKAFIVPGLSAIVTMTSQYALYLWIAIGLCAIFALVCIVICMKLHHWPHRGLRYVAYGTGGAFLMTLIAPLVLYITRLYEKLQITPQYIYICIMNYIQYVLKLFFAAAAVWLVITLILIIVISAKRKRAIRG